MGGIGLILDFERATRGAAAWPEVMVEDRTGENHTAEFFQSAGEDSPPLPGDNVSLMGLQRQGGRQAVGVIDSKNAGIAVPGEKRIYARDAAGAVVSELHLKNDGSATLREIGGAYVFQFGAGGAVSLTCTTFNIISTGLTHNGTNVGDTHTHAQGNDSNGDSEVDTDGPS